MSPPPHAARRRRSRSSSVCLASLLVALCCRLAAAQTPNSLPAADSAAPNRLSITPTFGQCFTNGTTTFRANMDVKWLLVPFDGDAPYYIVDQSATELTVEAGHRGGRLLVVAQATGCGVGTPCAEQVSSPACAGVATGEVTLAEAGVGVCSQAFANASWTIVPWWKARGMRTRPLRACTRCLCLCAFAVSALARAALTRVPPARACQVVGVTVMLTSMGVLFALVVVARLKLVNIADVAHSSTRLTHNQALAGPAAAFGAPPPLGGSGSSNRLTMSFGGPSAPLYAQVTRPDAASFA
jgi:hypothetical protein